MSNGEAHAAPKGVSAWVVVVLVALFLGTVIAGYLYFQSQKKVLNLLQVSALQAQRIEEFGKLSDQVAEFNSRFGARFGWIRTVESAGAVMSDIDRIRSEQGLPSEVDSLMAEFRATAEKVDYIGTQIEKLESRLVNPHLVARNQTHANIVMDYLTGEAGLTKDEAKEVMNRTALIWELEPGNKVYNIYWNGVFLTTVTQGEAPRSPLLVQQRVRQAARQRLEELEMQLQQLAPADTATANP